ncbi:MAG TPA: hypothetical protein VLE96_01720 [Chlamydiales bacterium]|nr:hypothetical protein [Chlamydiales bacterium]
MKKLAIISLALTTTCLSAFADFPIESSPLKTLTEQLEIVNICNLTDTDLNEIMEGHHPEMAIEFSAQTIIPIRFFLKGDLVNLIENEGKFGAVEVKQTFYARNVEEELILSTNLTDWKPFLEFITGIASVTLSIQDGQPSISIGAETNRRS